MTSWCSAKRSRKRARRPSSSPRATGQSRTRCGARASRTTSFAKYPDYAKRFREGTMPLDTPEFADVFAKAKVLFDRGYTQQGAVSTLYMDGNQMYIQGKAVQQFAGTWLAGIAPEDRLRNRTSTCRRGTPRARPRYRSWPRRPDGAVAEGPHKKQAIMLLDWMNGKGYHYYQNARGNIPHLKDPMGPVKLDQRMKTYLDKLYSYKQTAGLWFEYIPAADHAAASRSYTRKCSSGRSRREQAAADFRQGRQATQSRNRRLAIRQRDAIRHPLPFLWRGRVGWNG